MDLELPRAQIKRIVSSKLPTGADEKNYNVSKEGLAAFSESAKIFINYVSSTANEICKESKRQTISAEDVIQAMEDLEFGDLTPQLKEYLETYKKWSKERNQKKSEAAKKRKAGAEVGKTEGKAEADEAKTVPKATATEPEHKDAPEAHVDAMEEDEAQ